MKRIVLLLVVLLGIGLVVPIASAQGVDGMDNTEGSIAVISQLSQTVGGWGLALASIYWLWSRNKEQQRVMEDAHAAQQAAMKELLINEQKRGDKVMSVILKLLGQDDGGLDDSAPSVLTPHVVSHPFEK